MLFFSLRHFSERFRKSALLSIPISLFGILALSPDGVSQIRPDGTRTIHVKFKDDFEPGKKIPLAPAGRVGIPNMDEVNEKYGALSIKRIFPPAGKHEAAHRAYGLHLWYEIKVDKSVSVDDAIKDYTNLNYFHDVQECQEYTAIRASEEFMSGLPAGANDPQFPNQWHFHNTGQTGGTPGADINLFKAWEVETGSPNVVVAVIDGGIALDHPDLHAAIWTNVHEVPGNHLDDDHNGYADDVHGYGFGDGTSTIHPDDHGTHVAGTIGAISNNGIGVSGIAGGTGANDGVRLMSLATFGSFRNGGFEAAMVYAADNGAVISQNSWGGGSRAIQDAITYFIDRAGLDNTTENFTKNIQTGPMAGGIVIFAAGNSNTSDGSLGYPATYYKVFAVAATDHNDVKSYFSNYGVWVDICAPGSHVLSTKADGYGVFSGTSMACPHVSGVAALIVSKAQSQGLSPSEVKNRLRFSAKTILEKNPGYADLLGAGRLNAFVALQEPDQIPPSPVADLSVINIHHESVTLTWTATGESGTQGRAAAYEIRYSTVPITESNFGEAHVVDNPPVPPPSGETVMVEVRRLMTAARYYFAMKSSDQFNNISAISNTATAKTLQSPIPNLITPNVSAQVYSGGVASGEVRIENIGEDVLSIRLGTPDVESAPVGFAGNLKGRLFGINTSNNTFEEIDAASGEIVNSIVMPEPSAGKTEGLAFDGVFLYYGKFEKIYKINANTGEIVRSFSVNGAARIFGLAWSGRFLYASVYATSELIVKMLKIDADTGLILSTQLLGPGEFSFAGTRGTILKTILTSPGAGVGTGDIAEVDVETGAIVRQHSVGEALTGIGYSGIDNLIFASDRDVIKAVAPDSGNVVYTIRYHATTALAADEYKPAWIRTDEQVVTISTGETASLPVTFSANSLPSGQWSGSIPVIFDNINYELPPALAVPVAVSLQVIGATDILAPDEIDFGKQYVGFEIKRIVPIENRGFEDLEIISAQSNDPRITTSFSSAILAPGQKLAMTVTVVPEGQGPIEGILTIVSNDPDEDTLLLPVLTNVLPAPSLSIDVDSLSATISLGESTTLNFIASNNGGSILEWKANYTTLSRPNFAQSSQQGGATGESQDAEVSGIEGIITRASSPEQLTCLSYDPQEEFIYAKGLFSNVFYRYNLSSDNWSSIATTPENVYGQAAWMNGSIYHGGTQLAIYNIAGNSWTTVSYPVPAPSGNLTTDGQYIYVVFGSDLYRYDPASSGWSSLASLPGYIGPNGALSFARGVIYGHNDPSIGISGDGNTRLYKYYLESDTWIRTLSIPGEASSGSAIDPTGRRYFVVGAPQLRPGVRVQMSILDQFLGEWSKVVTPFQVGVASGLVSVGKRGASGIYFIQGGDGTGFACYQTPASSDWLAIAPTEGTLPPTGEQAFTITVNGDVLTDGKYTAALTVSSAHPPIQRTIPLTLNVVTAPNISTDKISGDVGDVPIGKSRDIYLTVRNTGTTSLVVDSVTFYPADFWISDSSFTLPTGERITLTAGFKPSVAGSQTGTFTIHSNDPDDQALQFTLSGNGIYPPILEVTPDSVHANLLSGATSVKNLTIRNTGGSTLHYGVVFRRADWLMGGTQGQLSPGDSISVPINFDASGKLAGTYATDIECWNWDQWMPIPVTMTVTNAPDIHTSSQIIEFDDQYVDVTDPIYSYEREIQIKNNGVLPLAISEISCDNPLFTFPIQAPIQLAPGESTGALVTFRPTSQGEQRGQLTFISNDPDEETHVIRISGTGVLAPVCAFDSSLISAAIFPDEETTKTVTFSNTGGSNLNWRIQRPSSFLSRASEEKLIALTFTSSGILFAQSIWAQQLFQYNPSKDAWHYVTSMPYNPVKVESGGAVFLDEKMYCVYPEDTAKITVFNFTLYDWNSIPNGLGAGTANITTDGTLLYLAGGDHFKSYDPGTGIWTSLALPSFPLNGAGGLIYHDGMIYAHEGAGRGFARYAIASGKWESLVGAPGKTVAGSAIDPTRNRYYAYGHDGLSYLYEYDIASNRWNAFAMELFKISDGSLAYDQNNQTLYFLQGKSGNGFAQYSPQAKLPWMRIAPLTGDTAPSDSETIGVNLSASDLSPGIYPDFMQVATNDPKRGWVEIPVRLEVKDPSPLIEVTTEISDTVARNVPYMAQVNIQNKGRDPLNWTLGNLLPVWLTVNKSSGRVERDGFENLEVTFHPNLFTSHVLDYTLQFNSNDVTRPAAFTNMKLTLENHAPLVVAVIPTQKITSGELQVPLEHNFSDADNDLLIYSASTANPDIATTSVSGSTLTISPLHNGTTTISVTAADIFDFSVTTTFTTTIEQVITAVDPEVGGLSASPNPFEKIITIQYHAEVPAPASLILYDISGKVVWRMNDFDERSGANKIEINGSTLNAGIYQCMLIRNGAPFASARIIRR